MASEQEYPVAIETTGGQIASVPVNDEGAPRTAAPIEPPGGPVVPPQQPVDSSGSSDDGASVPVNDEG